jgi:hypothetical protein
MDHPMQREKPLILHYEKRRYDGGVEIELIKYLEAERTVKLQEVQQKLKHDSSRSRRAWEALLIGPIELCVGAVGMMTTLFAIFAFTQLKNKDMVKQSKTVLKECLHTFIHGIAHSVLGPGRALKAAMMGA